MECLTDDVLTNVSIEVLEKHAFLFPEPKEDDSPDEVQPNLLQAHIGFSKGASGQLIMCLPVALAEEIAADMLGVDVADASCLVRDAMGELANVLCGNLMKATEFKDRIVDLAIPKVETASPENWNSLAAMEHTIELSVDGHVLLIHFQCDAVG